MSAAIRKNRISSPFLYAFRQAHHAKDAKKKLDLRDEAGERLIAGRRVPARIAITEAALRREVSHDLETLMNTVNLDASIDLHTYEFVARSILNYGFPDVVHRSIDELGVNDIRGEIETALAHFEPRLAPESLQVSRDDSIDPAALKVRFVVRADLCCEPVNVPVEFVADLEIDTGKIVISRR